MDYPLIFKLIGESGSFKSIHLPSVSSTMATSLKDAGYQGEGIIVTITFKNSGTQYILVNDDAEEFIKVYNQYIDDFNQGKNV